MKKMTTLQDERAGPLASLSLNGFSRKNLGGLVKRKEGKLGPWVSWNMLCSA